MISDLSGSLRHYLSLFAVLPILLILGLFVFISRGQISAQWAAAVGTLLLAAGTFITIILNYGQLRYLSREVRFQQRPRMSIYHERESRSFAIENTGEVPYRAEIRLSLLPYECAEEEDLIVDHQANYEELNDRVKEFPGGDNKLEGLLEPNEKTGWYDGIIRTPASVRHQNDVSTHFHWLRVDCILDPTVEYVEPRSFKRIFVVTIDDEITISGTTFDMATKKHHHKTD